MILSDPFLFEVVIFRKLPYWVGRAFIRETSLESEVGSWVCGIFFLREFSSDVFNPREGSWFRISWEFIDPMEAGRLASQVGSLLNHSVAFRLGTIKHSDFYQYLRTLCEESDVPLAHYKAMSEYIQYVLLSESVDPEKLFQETSRMEEEAYNSLVKTDQEKKLVVQSRFNHLLGKLLDFALTPEEWAEYKSVKGKVLSKSTWENLSSFENFYEVAELRDKAIAENLLAEMERSDTTIAVLVAGGFHSPGITKLISESGGTTVTFAPKITKVETEDGENYLSLFTQDKAPLDKLFEGEKLFLAPSPVAGVVGPSLLGMGHHKFSEGIADKISDVDAFNQLSGLSLNSEQVQVEEVEGGIIATVRPKTGGSIQMSVGMNLENPADPDFADHTTNFEPPKDIERKSNKFKFPSEAAFWVKASAASILLVLGVQGLVEAAVHSEIISHPIILAAQGGINLGLMFFVVVGGTALLFALILGIIWVQNFREGNTEKKLGVIIGLLLVVGFLGIRPIFQNNQQGQPQQVVVNEDQVTTRDLLSKGRLGSFSGAGWAAHALIFNQVQDLSEGTHLRINYTLTNGEAIYVQVLDSPHASNPDLPGNEFEVELGEGTHEVNIPVDRFGRVDWTDIKQIAFSYGPSYHGNPLNNEDTQLQINSVELVVPGAPVQKKPAEKPVIVQPQEIPVQQATKKPEPVTEPFVTPTPPQVEKPTQVSKPALTTDGSKKISIARTESGVWLNVRGQLWSGVPGFAYQPTPDGMHINNFENGRMAQLYKALLPRGGIGLDPEKYPDLIRLANRGGGASPQGHAKLLADAGTKIIRTYNLAATTEDDLKMVSQIFQWMYEQHGIMFIAGMYAPTENQVRFVANNLKDHRGLVLYDGWNEIDMRGANADTYREIDRLAGQVKEIDPNHPIALVVSQTIDSADAQAIKAMKNIDIVSVTIYNRDGQNAARYIGGLQNYFAPKVVAIGEIGVPTDVAPEARARQLQGIAQALTMTQASKPAPAPFFIHFEFTGEKWKGGDNKWWYIEKDNTPNASYRSVSGVHKKWTPGPKSSSVKAETPQQKPKVEPPKVQEPQGDAKPVGPITLNGQYSGSSWYGRWGGITGAQSKGILGNKFIQFTVIPGNFKRLTGFHVDIKGEGELGVYSLYVTKKGGKWSVSQEDSKAIVVEDAKAGRVSVTIPTSEIRAAMKEAGSNVIIQLHTQTGQQQNQRSLNSKNVPSGINVRAFSQEPKKEPAKKVSEPKKAAKPQKLPDPVKPLGLNEEYGGANTSDIRLNPNFLINLRDFMWI